MVVEELHGGELGAAVVGANKYRVDTAGNDAGEGKDCAERGFLLVGLCWVVGERVVVCYCPDAEDNGDEADGSAPRNRDGKEDEVDEGHQRCQEDPGNLIERNAAMCQTCVREEDVETHCDSQRENLDSRERAGREHLDAD